MMTRLIFAAAALAASLTAQQRTPVVVELFTSEGCSSCPPADSILSRLDREQPISGAEVIALGEHVDYWDRDGWRDRFSSALFTARQQDYGQAMKLGNVYTPQMVINGRAEVLGSDWDAANRAIRAAAQTPPLEAVTLKITGWDGLSVRVGSTKPPQAMDMFLAITESGLDTSVFGGENNGRRLRHTAVVRSMTRLGNLDKKSGVYSAETRVNLRPEWNRQNIKLILFVQERSSKKIVGAAAAHF
jgi:hypothetical protein